MRKRVEEEGEEGMGGSEGGEGGGGQSSAMRSFDSTR